MEQPSNGSSTSGQKKLSKVQWLLLIGCLGVALMILASYFQVERYVPTAPTPSESATPPVAPAAAREAREWSVEELEHKYETELKTMLEEVVGTGRVTVMVNLDSTGELVVEKNVQERKQTTDERDRQGAARQVEETNVSRQAVIYRQGNEETPLVLMQKRPQVRGVIIVAEGAENPQLKAWIMEAVQRGLGVPPHRVAILPRKKAS